MSASPCPETATPSERLARMIRVDHAGEYGAVRIYQGQLAVLGGAPRATSCGTCWSRRWSTSRRSPG